MPPFINAGHLSALSEIRNNRTFGEFVMSIALLGAG